MEGREDGSDDGWVVGCLVGLVIGFVDGCAVGVFNPCGGRALEATVQAPVVSPVDPVGRGPLVFGDVAMGTVVEHGSGHTQRRAARSPR